MIAKAFEPSQFNLLLAEVGLAKARLVEAAFAMTGISGRVHWVDNGLDVLTFLRRHGRYAHKPSSDLVLLDAQLMGKSGWDVLAEIRSDEYLSSTPVAIMAGDTNQHAVTRAQAFGADMILKCPTNVNCMSDLLIAMHQQWTCYRIHSASSGCQPLAV